MKLDHCAMRVSRAGFDDVIGLFVEQLGFRVLRRTDRSVWLRQPHASVDVQFIATPRTFAQDDKRFSQIAFTTPTPEQDLERLQQWLSSKRIESFINAYSPSEFYLDAPELFVDFVIEAMTPEMAHYEVESAPA